MAYTLKTLTANGSYLLVNVGKANRVNQSYQALVTAAGTFGAGTVNFAVSPDGGNTFLTLKDKDDNAVGLTANGYANLELSGYSNNNNKPLQLYVILSGAAGANVNIAVFDNA